MKKLDYVKFHAMRLARSNPAFGFLKNFIADRAITAEEIKGKSKYVSSDTEVEHVENLDKNGFTELNFKVDPDKLTLITKKIATLKCFDPFHKEYGDFTIKNLPSETHVANFRRSDLVRIPEILQLANDPGILRVVQQFLGEKPTISNVNMWWSVAGHKQPKDAQLFHRDVDDWKFLKLFIYLTDVSLENGPHVYVKGSSASEKLRRIKRYEDEEIITAFGKENVIYFDRAQGSMFLVDTFGFHKGLLPKSGNRLLLQVQYSSAPILIEDYTNKVKVKENYFYDKYINRLILE